MYLDGKTIETKAAYGRVTRRYGDHKREMKPAQTALLQSLFISRVCTLVTEFDFESNNLL